jgi:hypothetical protein
MKLRIHLDTRSGAILSMALLLFATGFGGGRKEGQSTPALLQGKWIGSLTERGKTVDIVLELTADGDTVKGSFKIESETGQDVKKGAVFGIVRPEIASNRLKFTVPIGGKMDDDAVVFELDIQKDQLTGSCQEMRKGSQKLPVTFKRRN